MEPLRPPVGRPPAPTVNPVTGEPVGTEPEPGAETVTPPPTKRNPLALIFSPGWFCKTDACRDNVRYSIFGTILGIAAFYAWKEYRDV